MTQTLEAPEQYDRDGALQYYRDQLDAGQDPSATELAATFRRTDRWARKIRADVQAERGAVPAAPAERPDPIGTPDPEPSTTPAEPAERPAFIEPVPAAAAPETPESAPDPDERAENLPAFAQNGAQEATAGGPRPSGHLDQSGPVEPQDAERSAVALVPVADPAPAYAPEQAPATGTTVVPVTAPAAVPAAPAEQPAPVAVAERNAAPGRWSWLRNAGTRAWPWSRNAGTADPEPDPEPNGEPVRSWPLILLSLPAFVAVWSGWVGLGEMTGFGVVHPLPGIADGFTLNTAITLPIGVETYAAFALRVWLSGQGRARRFAKWSALSALVLGALGQVAYHLLDAAGYTRAPWQITTVVACLPVLVLGMGAALVHLNHAPKNTR